MHASLATFLDAPDSASKVMSHGRLLLKLSHRFAAIAPAGLAHYAHVANYKSGKLVIHADNGAVATKIRQMSQRLCDELSKGGTQCNGIEIKVQPRQIPYRSTISPERPLSGRAVGSLRGVAGELPEGSPLRDALERLLQTAARSDA